MHSLDKHIKDAIIAFRRELHRFPELSGQELQTAERICRQLDALGLSYKKNVGGHGIVVDIQGKEGSPRLAFRADMDALPIQEESGLDFSSQHSGVMHACGHDGHSAILLGLAMCLSKEKELPVSVRLIFQPAEEIAEGAKAMIAEGVLDGVDMIFGCHVDRHYPAGTIMVSDDSVNAASDKFYITVSGQGGHAARPHEAVDAVLVGSAIVTSIQSIISREIDPSHPAVITVGKFEAGTAANVIAGTARLEGTIRSLDATVRQYLEEALHRICDFAAKLHGASVSIEFKQGMPPLLNSPDLIPVAKKAVVDALGAEKLVPKTAVNMGGEDFAYYLDHCPGIMVRLGAAFDDKETPPAHSSSFDFNEAALESAVLYFYQLCKG